MSSTPLLTVHAANLDLWFVIDDCAYNLAASFHEPMINSKHKAVAGALLRLAVDRLEGGDA